MNTPLNNTTQQKARELARKITVAHDLDPEIQEELYGHIEDKLLAYKSGELSITEEDKDFLARHRMGGSEHTSRCIAIPQLPDLNIGWARQVVLLALATTCAIIASQILLDAYQWCFPWREFENQILRNQTRFGAELLWWFAAPGFLLLILHRWSSRLQKGGRPWFARVSPVHLSAITLALIAAGDAIPKILIPLDGRGLNVEIDWMQHWSVVTTFHRRGALCLIWMAWACSFSRSTLRTTTIGIAWVIFYHLASILPGSIAILTENANQRLYAPYWLGEIAWGQLRPERLLGHAAYYLAIIAVCSLLLFLATQNWRGIGRAVIHLRDHRKVRSNSSAMNTGFVDGAPLTDEEALLLIRARFGDPEELQTQLQRVHLGAARALPMRRILALAIATLAMCAVSDIVGSAMRLAAAMAVAADVIPRGDWLLVALGLSDFPLISAGLLWLLFRWRQVSSDEVSRWFQRWPLRRMALVAGGLFLLQLVLPALSVAPRNTFGGTVLPEFFSKALLIPVLLAIWLWWSGATTGGPRWIAATSTLLSPVLMAAVLQPLRIFNLMPRVLVVDEGADWIYLNSTSLGQLNLDLYFAPNFTFTIGAMNLYALCVGGILLFVGLKELDRELSWARRTTGMPSDGSPPRLT